MYQGGIPMAKPVLISQRKLNDLVRQAYNQTAWETVQRRAPTKYQEDKAIKAFLANTRQGNDTYRFNGVDYQVWTQPTKAPTKTKPRISYKDIERAFPEYTRVKRGKNIVYIDKTTGKEISRRQAEKRYSEEVRGEKYQEEYSKRTSRRANQWHFGLRGLDTVSIPLTRKKQNSYMGEFMNIIKDVINKNSARGLAEFKKKHHGKAIITDVATETEINLCDITYDEIVESFENGSFILPNGEVYIREAI